MCQADFSPKRFPPHFLQGLCEEQKVFEFWAVRLYDFEPVQVTLGVKMEKRPARGSDSAPKLPKVAYLFVAYAIAVFVDEFLHLDGPVLAALHTLDRQHWIEMTRHIRVHEARDRAGHFEGVHRVAHNMLCVEEMVERIANAFGQRRVIKKCMNKCS